VSSGTNRGIGVLATIGAGDASGGGEKRGDGSGPCAKASHARRSEKANAEILFIPARSLRASRFRATAPESRCG
jgi:hypothetical protein